MAEHIESHSTSTAPQSQPNSPAFQFVIGIAMIVVLLIASLIVGQRESKSVAAAVAAAATTPPAAAPTTEATPATAAAPAEPAAAASPAPVAAAATPESSDIKSHLEELTAHVKKLQGMVDSLPKPEPVPDLKPIQDKVDDLTKSVAATAPLVEKMDKLEGHVGDLGKQIQSLESNVLTVKQGIEAASRKPAR